MEDRLSGLLAQFSLKASTFYSGSLCGNHHFPKEGVGHLHLCRGGELQVTHADISEVLASPSVAFYPKAIDHTICTDPNSSVEVICATVKFSSAEYNPIVLSLPDMVLHTGEGSQLLTSTINLLFYEALQPGCGQSAIVDRLCEILIIQLIRLQIEESSITDGALAGLAHQKLCLALMAMHDDPSKSWNLDMLSKIALMSRTQFAKTFHLVVGQTPLAYLNQWRMSLATQSLTNGQSIGRVALDLGFNSQSSFSRSFTHHFGKSPRTWISEQ
ncbi:MAG: AraC family transcriptional regulator [Candidatus Thiodiazotropha sp. 6PLUC5]